MADLDPSASLRRYQRALLTLLVVPVLIAALSNVANPQNPWIKHGISVAAIVSLTIALWILTYKFTRSRWLRIGLWTVGPIMLLATTLKFFQDMQWLGDLPFLGYNHPQFELLLAMLDLAVSAIMLFGLCLVIVETPAARIELLEQQIQLQEEVRERRQLEDERRQLESKLWQAQKAESIGLLAGGIAHDFNNLLMGIMGNADLLRLDLPPNSENLRRAESILTASERAAELTAQLLAYAGRGQFVRESINLSDLIHDTAVLLKTQCSGRAELIFDLAEELPAIECDPAQLRQVIMNLTTNAAEALDGTHGRIEIRTSSKRLSRQELDQKVCGHSLDEGDYVLLSVSDTGTGMSERAVHRIFDPYYSTKAPGRGLGLSSVLGIVKGNDGAILVDSELRRGTAMTVVFAASERPAVELDRLRDSGEVSVSHGGTVLIADDETIVLKLGQDILRRAGFDVIPASNGREAVEAFKENATEICLAILDITMPELDGHEAYVAIRGLDENVPVLLSSGFSEESVSDEMASDPLVGFLHKPYQAGRMLESIDSLLAAGRLRTVS